MALTPYDRKISDIFKKDGSYDIDFYQREYKWNKDAVNALLDDIFSKFDENYNENIEYSTENIQKFDWYYLNNFMTNEDRGKTYIVDGQQRTTTISLIISALIKQLSEMDKMYFERFYLKEDGHYRITPLSRDKDYFINMLEGKVFEPNNKSQRF